MQTMTEEDKNVMLEQIKSPEANYNMKLWGTIMASTGTIMKIGAGAALIGGGALAGVAGALSNNYCYIGVTNNDMRFVVIDSFNLKEVKDQFVIPFNAINRVKVSRSLIPGRRIVKIKTDNSKMKLSLCNKGIGSNLKYQRDEIAELSKMLLACNK